MPKERAKDKGGTLNGQSKSAHNNRSPNGKENDPENTTNREMKNTGQIKR